MTARRAVALGVCSALLGSGAILFGRTQNSPPASPPTLEGVMTRAADYADLFVERFSNVVTEERYVQTLERRSGGAPVQVQARTLRSDLIFVGGSTPLEGTMLRDVFEVDGKPVRDREERLTRLLTESSPTALVQATRIATESARYNIGPGERTTNTPELALLFVERSLQSKFRFSLGRRDSSEGDRVWVVEYREQSRPTIVRSPDGGPVPASGRLWIDADTGQVVRATITLRPQGGVWLVDTTFKLDPRFGIAVPVRMDERFDVSASRVIGTATYGRFRSFAVTTDEALEGNETKTDPARDGETR